MVSNFLFLDQLKDPIKYCSGITMVSVEANGFLFYDHLNPGPNFKRSARLDDHLKTGPFEYPASKNKSILQMFCI